MPVHLSGSTMRAEALPHKAFDQLKRGRKGRKCAGTCLLTQYPGHFYKPMNTSAAAFHPRRRLFLAIACYGFNPERQNRYPTFKYVTIGFSLSFASVLTVSGPTGVWACVVSLAVACKGTKESEKPANQCSENE